MVVNNPNLSGTVSISANPTGAVSLGSSVTFTATQTSGGFTPFYQWQVNGINEGTNSNSFTYVPANNDVVTCLISSCSNGQLNTSNAITENVYNIYYVPITLTNSQSSPTTTNLQEQIYVNSSLYTSYENNGLQNIEFTTGPHGTGTILQAWIESGAYNTSISTLYWVDLGSTTIAVNSSLIIYMNFMPGSVMTGSTGYTGVAPQEYKGGAISDCGTNCAQTSYGQYDNGATVFLTYANAGGPTPTGLSISAPSSFPFIGDALTQWLTGQSEQDLDYASPPSSVPVDVFSLRGNGNPQSAFVYYTTSCCCCWVDGNTISAQNPELTIQTLEIISSSSIRGYAQYQTTNTSTYNSSAVIIGGWITAGGTCNSYWIRGRTYPPNGTMPSYSLGTVTHQ